MSNNEASGTEPEQSKGQRPGFVTAFAVFIAIGIAASLFLAFATDTLTQYHLATLAWCILGIVMAVGFWRIWKLKGAEQSHAADALPRAADPCRSAIEENRRCSMIGGNQELHDYVTNAEGISRKRLNIICFIGVFIFGWLLTMVFESLGKKGKGWLYIVPIMALLVISQYGESPLGILAPVIYVVGWVHANLVLSHYQNLARKRIMAIENEPPSANLLLEEGILYHKVLHDKDAARSAFEKVSAHPDGVSADLLNLAGVALLADGNPSGAITFFDRALAETPDDPLAEQMTNNRESAKKAASKK